MAYTSSGVHNYITPEEAHAIIDVAQTPRDRLLVRLFWETGGRVSEIINLRPGDVKNHDEIAVDNEKQHIPEGTPLPKKFCLVSPDLVTEIETYAKLSTIRRGGYLFPGRNAGMPLTRHAVLKLIKRLARDAGVVKVKRIKRHGVWVTVESFAYPHLFRHGCAVNLIRQRIPPKVVQAQLGHKRLETTDGYMEIFSEDRREAMREVRF